MEGVFQSSVLRYLQHGQYLNFSNVAASAKQDVGDNVAAPETICPAFLFAYMLPTREDVPDSESDWALMEVWWTFPVVMVTTK